MNFDPQAVAAPAIVLIAIAYLARVLVGKWLGSGKTGGKPGCGSCGSCGNVAARNEPEIVSIGSVKLAVVDHQRTTPAG